MQAQPTRSVAILKAMLMNSAETEIFTNPALLPGQLAPITRIGAGEVRVDKAVGLTAAAWNRDSKSAALSFGAREVAGPTTLTRRLRIENFAPTATTFSIEPSFRFADDEATGAVVISAPSSVSVPGRRVREITVTMTIDPTKLPNWTMNGGPQGGNGALLNANEYDGYLTLSDGTQTLSVPWHVLPRKASSVSLTTRREAGKDILRLTNTGLAAGEFEFFSLTGKSPRIPSDERPNPGDGFAVIDLHQVGVRVVNNGAFLQFGISTFDRRSHPIFPAEFDIGISTDADADYEWIVFNYDIGLLSTGVIDGRNAVWLLNVATGQASASFFNDADLNSRNAILTVPLAAIGATAGTTIAFDVYAFDSYFTGALTDAVTGMRYTIGNPRYSAPILSGVVPASASGEMPLTKAIVPRSQSSETGALLLYRRNRPAESQSIVRGQ